jgi:Flp pilus assembly protein TadG
MELQRTGARKTGSVLVMMTLAAIPMFAVVGLAVDLGWSFYVKRTAQAAADAAAMAAAKAAKDLGSGYTCGALECTGATPLPCPGSFSGNLIAACQYAQRNGFDPSANSRQSVRIMASDATNSPTQTGVCFPGTAAISYPPTAPCVRTYYWVTVIVTEQVPQLFSAIFGASNSLVAARATGAVVEAELPGSLYLLNRAGDANPNSLECGPGIDLCLGGTPTLTVPGGIILASNSSSSGEIKGGGIVTTPRTWIMQGGALSVSNNGSWSGIVDNSQGDGSQFQDPMTPKVHDWGQPPVNVPNVYIPVPGGVLTSTNANCLGGICPPGIYYASDASGNALTTPTQISTSGTVTFGATGTFGNFVFFGGLNINSSTVSFNPGVYVMAGGVGGNAFNADNNVTVFGGTGENSDAGRMFLLTDSSYGTTLDNVRTARGIPQFSFGGWQSKSGSNSPDVYLYGLNPNDPTVISNNLNHWGPLLIWQDMRNSTVKYDLNPASPRYGNVDTSCAGATQNSPCTTGISAGVSQAFQFNANPNMHLGGIVYQPRGAYTEIWSGSGYSGPLRIVTGALSDHSGASLTLIGPMTPFTTPVAALIE